MVFSSHLWLLPLIELPKPLIRMCRDLGHRRAQINTRAQSEGTVRGAEDWSWWCWVFGSQHDPTVETLPNALYLKRDFYASLCIQIPWGSLLMKFDYGQFTKLVWILKASPFFKMRKGKRLVGWVILSGRKPSCDFKESG